MAQLNCKLIKYGDSSSERCRAKLYFEPMWLYSSLDSHATHQLNFTSIFNLNLITYDNLI